MGEWGAEPRFLVRELDRAKTRREVWELMLSGKVGCKAKTGKMQAGGMVEGMTTAVRVVSVDSWNSRLLHYVDGPKI